MENKKYYITTSIPYTNAPPHIGHVLEFIQADVLARYHRGLGRDVFFLTGTDEHGLKTLRAAEAAGKETMEFADEVSGKFRELLTILNISNDDFIRTTDEIRHKPSVYKLWEKYLENGDIYKKKYKGYYNNSLNKKQDIDFFIDLKGKNFDLGSKMYFIGSIC